MEIDLLVLSPREIEILGFMKKGLSSKEIAENLQLSSHTIDTHRRNMLKKSRARNSVELVLYGVKSGMI